MKNINFIRSAAHYLYLKSSLYLKPCDIHDSRLLPSPESVSSNHGLRIAFICDEMTWQDFSPYGSSIFLLPKIWKKQLQQHRPDLLFCESAWSGICGYEGVWRGRIYRDRRVSFENRDILLEILKYCQENKIPTVFWNKEDPAYYAHPVYDFTDTALLMDYVFTTARECIDGYRKQGHTNVNLLPFAVNTSLFYPPANKPEENTVLFAGSWFGDHPVRCQQLEQLLDYALEQGWKLDIYDRNSDSSNPKFRFPEKYAPYLHPAVSFTEIADVCRRYQYAINVNTVVNSSTMISRRVLQLAACGVTIVSNNSLGFEGLRDCLEVRSYEDNGIVFAYPIPEAVGRHSTKREFLDLLNNIKFQENVLVTE